MLHMLSPILTVYHPMDLAHQASLSMGFPRQEDWSRLPFPSPRDLPDPGIELASLASFALKVKMKVLSRVCLFATLWTTQSMEFSRPEYWSG